MDSNIKQRLIWLHLSDFHLCKPKSGWRSDDILKKLQEDFGKIANENNQPLIPDLIFITGDIVFGDIEDSVTTKIGKSISEQFNEAEILIEKIRNSFNPQIEKKNIFIVPGNHDINKNKLLKENETKSKDQPNESNKEINVNDLIKIFRDNTSPDFKIVKERLLNYREFLEKTGYGELFNSEVRTDDEIDKDKLIYSKIIEVKGFQLGIAGFNSAWPITIMKNEKGKILIDADYQIHALIKNIDSAQIKIGLMHHPWNWLHKMEDPFHKRQFSNRFDFFLHGHEHVGWIEERINNCIDISTGACYGHKEGEMGYNMVCLESDEKRIFGKIYLRKYNSSGEEGWIPNVIPGRTNDNGVYTIKKQIKVQHKSEKIITGSILNQIYFSGKKNQFKDYLFDSLSIEKKSFVGCNFSETKIKYSEFIKCSFKENTIFNNTIIKNSRFFDTVFRDMTFQGIRVENCIFKKCYFINCEFIDNSFIFTNFIKSNFLNIAGKKNSFIGCGFFMSPFDLDSLQENFLFGNGKPDTKFEDLNPFIQGGDYFPVGLFTMCHKMNWLISGSRDGIIRLWDINQGRLLKVYYGHQRAITSLALTSDNTRFFSSSEDGIIKIWELETGNCLGNWDEQECCINAIAVSPNDKYFVSGNTNGIIKLCDINNKSIKEIKNSRSITTVCFSPDSKSIIAGSKDNTIKFWHVKNIKLKNSFCGHQTCINTIAISNDEKFLVSGGDNNKINIIDIQKMKLFKSITIEDYNIKSIVINNNWIIYSSEKGIKRFMITEKDHPEKIFKFSKNRKKQIALSQDNSFLISSGYERDPIKIYDISNGKIIHSLLLDSISDYSVFLDDKNNNLNLFILNGLNLKIKKWNVEIEIRKESEETQISLLEYNKMFFCSNWLLIQNKDLSIYLWNVSNINKIQKKDIPFVSINPSIIRYAIFDQEAKRIFCLDELNRLLLIDIETKYIYLFHQNDKEILSLAFSPDKNYVISGGQDHTVKIWDIKTFTCSKRIFGHHQSVLTVSVSPDNEMIISGSADHTIKIWELKTGNFINSINAHNGAVRVLTVSHDNNYIISGGDDFCIKIWDIKTGKLFKEFNAHQNRLNSLFVTSDFNYIISSSMDNTIKIWDIQKESLICTTYILPDGKTLTINSKNHIISGLENDSKFFHFSDKLALYNPADIIDLNYSE